MSKEIDRFRRLALELPETVEGSHMGHPDFRCHDRIFATLSPQEQGLGMVKLTVEQQADFVGDQPDMFTPVPGGWGRMGMTHVRLALVNEATLRGALKTAHHNLEAKQAAKRSAKRKAARL